MKVSEGRPITIEGFDQIFNGDSSLTTESVEPDNKVTNGLTIRQASAHYRLSIPTIRLKIKTGDIAAVKVNGPKGPEWRVFPSGIPAAAQIVEAFDQADDTIQEPSHQADSATLEAFYQANNNLSALIEANQALMAKLEAVVYRNGYLESQVSERQKEIDSQREQIKLLTDSQHKSGWWAHFCSWFVGAK